MTIHIPDWYRKLFYDGCDEESIALSYSEFRDYREEGHSTDYILTCVQGLKDPYE